MAGWSGTISGPTKGTAASIGLHALALGALLLLAGPLRPLEAPPTRAIAVELMSSARFEALRAPPALAAAPIAPARKSPPEAAGRAPGAPTIPGPVAPRPDANSLTPATELYAAAILASPGAARIRAGLTKFADGERIVQLRNIEGLEQIRRAAPQYDPDTLVSYAMADPVATGLALTAIGGAFRSRRRWYAISFECVAAPALDGVASFSFKLGAPIPEADWATHDLYAEDKAE